MNGEEQGLTYSLTYREVVEILKIIDQSACRELVVELGDLRLKVVRKIQTGNAVSCREELEGDYESFSRENMPCSPERPLALTTKIDHDSSRLR